MQSFSYISDKRWLNKGGAPNRCCDLLPEVKAFLSGNLSKALLSFKELALLSKFYCDPFVEDTETIRGILSFVIGENDITQAGLKIFELKASLQLQQVHKALGKFVHYIYICTTNFCDMGLGLCLRANVFEHEIHQRKMHNFTL